jgi:2-keto-4-pentenoate hydratase/2-oxohepta-3-ene-1,7-dioic acid hydratase in catechol pathway
VRLVSFSLDDGVVRTGVLAGDEVVGLSHPEIGLSDDMAQLLGVGSEAMEVARRAPNGGAPRWPLDSVRLRAPVPSPSKVLGIGLNYRDHAAETGREPPPFQYWFNKQRTCITGPGDPIIIPSVSEQVDYEGELAMIIGRRCRHVPAERALEVVAGFCVINDVSVRDWQNRTPTFTMGKSFDSHGPLGPHLVTVDEVGSEADLRIRTWVNDELRQDSSTSNLIFSCREMIEYLTTVFPLEPGDVLATGTPAGVGVGFTPPRWLRPGDGVRIEIEGVGVLENPVVSAGPDTPLGLDP